MGKAATKLPSDVLELLDISWAPGEGGLKAFLTALLKSCERWFEASGASIFLRVEDTQTFRIAARAGTDARIPDDAIIIDGKGIAGASIQSGEAMLINDPADHPLLAKRELAKRKGIQSALVLPLVSPGNKCQGVINLSRKNGQEPFKESDLQNAKALARYVTLAVSNARMLAEIRESKTLVEASHNQLIAVINSLGVAVVIVDEHGDTIDKNCEAAKLLSKAPNVLQMALQTALDDALKGKAARSRPHDNKEDRTWSVIATPVPSGGATAVIEEITESERTNAEHARINRLAEIGQMTATIAHEIRNPLTGIRSAAQMVSISPEDAQKFGRVIEQESIKLNALCDEFLDFAKPITVKRKPVNAADLARRLAAALFRQFSASKVHLKVQIESGEPTIELDELRIEQVIRNLLLNALQASSPEGVVRLEVHEWGFAVEDEGSGMTAEIQERLFTPFFTTKTQGTGLGLSTCRKIVDAHGGAMHVSSKPGEGARFEVVFKNESTELRLSA